MFLLHILGGTTALATFLVPLLAKKGSRLHVRFGWIFVTAISTVGLTAYLITPWRAFLDPLRTSASESFAIFLMFIATLTLSSLSYGLLAIKRKARTGPVTGPLELAPALLLMIGSAIVEGTGIARRDALFMVFPVVGAFTALEHLRYWRSTPTSKMHGWYAHMSGMGTACIATITAFLVTAVPRLTEAAPLRSPWLWIAPGAVLGTGLNCWSAYYRKRFDAARISAAHD